MTTVQILTKNNQSTIEEVIQSVKAFDNIVVGDLGSSDRTLAICEKYGIHPINVYGMPRNEARMQLLAYGEGPTIMLQPWEVVVQGHLNLNRVDGVMYVKVMTNQSIIKEARVWAEDVTLENPTFERVTNVANGELDLLIYCIGSRNSQDDLEIIKHWKHSNPISPSPYYYEGCVHLSEARFNEALCCLEHYVFLDKSWSMSATMARYYCAVIYIMQKRKVRPALQCLNLCLCANPLMSEFWCLTGDIYYHLLHKFWLAKEFYENAIIMGSRRLISDIWPMDISKYRKYPNKMIESCDAIIKHSANYVQNVSK